ncbi:MAG: hypothetical protein Kow0090_09420 [Myxococcota bacterium]
MILLGTFTAALFFLVGCLAPPLKQVINDADERVFAAGQVGAEKCAPMEMNAAKKRLREAKEMSVSSGKAENARVAAMAAKHLAEKAISLTREQGEKCQLLEEDKPATGAN